MQQTDSGSVVPVVPAEPTVSVVEPPKGPSVGELLLGAKSQKEAWAICTPYFKNVSTGEKENMGKTYFSLWAKDNLKWRDVNVPADETSPGLVFKNPEKERGKRICATGTVIQITERSDWNASEGLFLSYSDILYNYRNFGSSGKLTQRSEGRLCGYVAGTYSYRNSGGGVGHAIDLVGVWKLPENK